MSILEIMEFPHPILKKTAEPLTDVNSAIEQLVRDMTETMYQAPGVGLAATQVGVDKALAVIDVSSSEEPRNPIVIVNPRIIEMSEITEKGEEGCLSVPDLRAEVERAVAITVIGKDLQGNDVRLEANDFLARVLQHEIDHLNGTLFLDRIGKLKRQLYVKNRKKALGKK